MSDPIPHRGEFQIDMAQPDYDQHFDVIGLGADPRTVWVRRRDGIRVLVPREAVDLVPTGLTGRDGRPTLLNSDGSVSSEQAITITDSRLNQGMATTVPTIFKGKKVSDENAIRTIAANKGKDPETGRQLKGHKTINDAVKAEEAYHKTLESDPVIELVRQRFAPPTKGDLPSGKSMGTAKLDEKWKNPL